MRIARVVKDLYLRIGDRRIKFFESLQKVPEGVTYNSYVLTTSEK